ncbi:Sirtuin family [Carpediemonas membranifera]|uniref:Sirtuin family n=1 Tax=Carpediemonas membranifera TaxID=201153 RepID=A0A8J6B0U6_9EUKA|nr:Sirtuin family [Carpediemonas membranifera]|eukprot:KAG9393168.1 Sirtuin family [Carpediemonas membranifera]
MADVKPDSDRVPLDAETRANISELAQMLVDGQNVVFITGAGLSVASGITPYRYRQDAIWSNFVTEWGTRKRFKEDPFAWWNEFWLRTHEKPEFLNAKPNAGHHMIARILQCTNTKLVTQNIDRLHSQTSVPVQKLVEVHGRLGKYKCITPNCEFSTKSSLDIPDLDAFSCDGSTMASGNLRVHVPLCPSCHAPIMPQSLFFDEKYTSHAFFNWPRVVKWLTHADIFVFIGTSFSVGVTQEAVAMGRRTGKRMFNFNLYADPEYSDLLHVVAPSSDSLALLCEKIISLQTDDRNVLEKPRLWYRMG